MQTRQLYASITATIGGTVYVELPTQARIKAIELILIAAGALAAVTDYCHVEVSMSPNNQTAVNDALGVLAGIAALGNHGSDSVFVLTDCQCKAGDRIYLNATESGTTTWIARAVLHYV